MKFTRRYLDQNRLTYAFHAGSSFDTPEGLNTTHAIFEAAQDFNITSRLGVSPQSAFYYYSQPRIKSSLKAFQHFGELEMFLLMLSL